MRAKFLADTSALARLTKPEVARVLEPLVIEGAVAISAIVNLEILRYTLGPADHQRAAANLLKLEKVGINDRITERALTVQAKLAQQSEHRGVKVPDLLIAAAAEAAGLVLLHYD
ncbi:MAG: PIN domain-containing protein, partial [Candidatus Dormibacteraceae bacterium]